MKKTKISPNRIIQLLTILFAIGLIASLSTSTANNGNSTNQGEQATAANNSSSTLGANSGSNQAANASITNSISERYNRTDEVPKNQTEQVRAREQATFQYRNMIMTMNCTQNCTVSFTADEEVAPKIFGLNVDPNQTMTLTMNLTKAPLQGVMVNERNLNFYLDIEPSGALKFQAQLRLYINQTELSQNVNREVNASRLTWMYWNQTRAQWETVQSYMDQNGYLVCNTDHFSSWTVAEEASEQTAIPPTQNSAFQIEYIAVIAAIALVAIAVGIVAYKKRK
ncbi:MAG: hypothetical protein NWE98_09000 [Candidatus Bathyarchaeota archaeon]|nr:hypothetical protein [Candidatus Bathyarchaeota archaeon]